MAKCITDLACSNEGSCPYLKSGERRWPPKRPIIMVEENETVNYKCGNLKGYGVCSHIHQLKMANDISKKLDKLLGEKEDK